MALFFRSTNFCSFNKLSNFYFSFLQKTLQNFNFIDIKIIKLYVPGELSDIESVMVDVGTGYYVQKVKTFITF